MMKVKNRTIIQAPIHHTYIMKQPRLVSELGIKQLLIDLPSMDREDDGGKLLAHRAFWNYPSAPRINSTITELIYVPPTVAGWNIPSQPAGCFLR
jgi:hypothetical protein